MMNQNKFAFASILYFPNENAIENIKKSLEHGFKVIVYLNRVENNDLEILKKLDVVVLGANVNVGLGSALSCIESYLLKNEFGYYVFFDQDTIVPSVIWKKISKSYIKDFSKQNTGLVFYTAGEVSNNIVINSGSLFSLDIINRLGKHDDNYFVEGVDYEYCLRLKKEGYEIKTIVLPEIDHYSMQDGFTRNILGMSFNFRVYGNSRLLDFNEAHIKLLKSSIVQMQLGFFCFFIKSLVAFNVKEIISRVCMKVIN